jgi:hypothetical protein
MSKLFENNVALAGNGVNEKGEISEVDLEGGLIFTPSLYVVDGELHKVL